MKQGGALYVPQGSALAQAARRSAQRGRTFGGGFCRLSEDAEGNT